MEVFKRFRNRKYVLLLHVFTYGSHLRKLITEFPWHDQEPWVHNALLEATLVKARAILNFLDDQNQNLGDIRAIDFLKSWKSDLIQFNEFKKLINKHVAHLTKKQYLVSNLDIIKENEFILNQLRLVVKELDRFESEYSKLESGVWEKLRSDSDIY